jgi:hypothetical protein
MHNKHPCERSPRARSQPSRASLKLAGAALLGAAAGSLVAQLPAGACSCSDPKWRLELTASSERDDSVWPERATLTAFPGLSVLSFWAYGTDAKVDHFMGGTWSRR